VALKAATTWNIKRAYNSNHRELKKGQGPELCARESIMKLENVYEERAEERVPNRPTRMSDKTCGRSSENIRRELGES